MPLSTETPFGTYAPEPIDTSAVEFSEEMHLLREQIAEQVHDTWAAGRLAEGWTYGSARNDDLKQNPTLVPYADLSDEEKAYDRRTAEATVAMLVQLGWTIVPPAVGAMSEGDSDCGCGCGCGCEG